MPSSSRFSSPTLATVIWRSERLNANISSFILVARTIYPFRLSEMKKISFLLTACTLFEMLKTWILTIVIRILLLSCTNKRLCNNIHKLFPSYFEKTYMMAIGDVIPHVVRSYQSKQSVTHKNTDMYLHFWIKTFYLIVVFISRKGEKCNILNFKCACIVGQFLGKVILRFQSIWINQFETFHT